MTGTPLPMTPGRRIALLLGVPLALAIIAWPLHKWLADRAKRDGLAAVATTLVVVLVILVPGLFVSYQIAREAVRRHADALARVLIEIAGAISVAPAILSRPRWGRGNDKAGWLG